MSTFTNLLLELAEGPHEKIALSTTTILRAAKRAVPELSDQDLARHFSTNLRSFLGDHLNAAGFDSPLDLPEHFSRLGRQRGALMKRFGAELQRRERAITMLTPPVEREN